MTAIALPLLFAAAGLVALAVLARSYMRAVAVHGELRRAAMTCEETLVATIRVTEFPRRPAPLRLVSSPARQAVRAWPQPALRAAA